MAGTGVDARSEMAGALGAVRTESGAELLGLVEASPVLLIFLRHFGCAFCRKAISDVADLRAGFDSRGVRPVFVHMGTPERAKPFFDYYGMQDVERVSDPEATLYKHPVFKLPRQPVAMQFVTPAVWKGWLTGALKKYGIGAIKEDGQQMPGLFFLKGREIVRVFRYKTIADEPDYLKLIE